MVRSHAAVQIERSKSVVIFKSDMNLQPHHVELLRAVCARGPIPHRRD